MKISDVKTGEVYAYREGSYGFYSQAVLLSLEKYEYQSGKPLRKSSEKKAFASRYSSLRAGYLAAVGPDVSGASLEQALAEGIGYVEGCYFQYMILTSARWLHGPYGEVMAAEEAAEKAADEQRRKNRERRAEHESKVAQAIKALEEKGIKSYQNYSGLYLHPDEAEKLTALLNEKGET